MEKYTLDIFAQSIGQENRRGTALFCITYRMIEHPSHRSFPGVHLLSPLKTNLHISSCDLQKESLNDKRPCLPVNRTNHHPIRSTLRSCHSRQWYRTACLLLPQIIIRTLGVCSVGQRSMANFTNEKGARMTYVTSLFTFLLRQVP